MDAQRRSQVAAAGAALIHDMQDAVVESWSDLLPTSASWRPDDRARAVAATRAALGGLVTALRHGDLDDRSWAELRETVFASGRITPEDAADLLRSVRIVGLEVLADRLVHDIGMGHEERWQLQREASSFCTTLLGTRDELDPSRFDELLDDLQRSGPDMA